MTLQNTYLGAQLDGDTNQLMANVTYTIPITASTDGWLAAIEAELAAPSTTVILLISAGVYADNGGQPGSLLRPSQVNPTDRPTINTTTRWVSLPVGAWLTAGSYHLGVSFNSSSSPVLRKRTGGSSGDGHTIDVAVASLGDPDYSLATVTATTDTYSIRGVFITEVPPVGPSTELTADTALPFADSGATP